MPEDHDVTVEHPDLDQAVEVDDHGPAFPAVLEGLDAGEGEVEQDD
jgi:hypothetical protein